MATDPPAPGGLPGLWHSVRNRLLGGLVMVLPVIITAWVLYWLYTTLEVHVIDPLARFVIWNVRGGRAETELPHWFEAYAAPVIGIIAALLLLYGLGFFAQTRLRRGIDWVLLRVPGVSIVYKGTRQVFETLERQGGPQRTQRVVLIPFPHPGMKAPAFVTSTCRDVATQKVLLCVYVPTTPVPTSGYFLLVPEEEVTELDWGPELALQTIISGGLTAPPQVAYYRPMPPAVPVPNPTEEVVS